MASKATDSPSNSTESDDAGNLVAKMNRIKKQIQARRPVAVREKIERNAKKLEAHILRISSQLTIDDNSAAEGNTSAINMLSWRAENPVCKLSGCARGFGDKDPVSCHDYVPQSCIKLDYVRRLPPYTTWIFLDRNQRMADDQSVLGRRRIYYNEEHGSEALICSDSEEEIMEPEDEKREFTEGEDQILTTIFGEHGLDEEVVKDVSNYIGATALETKERYASIVGKSRGTNDELGGSGKGILLDKSLTSALDSFDNLFCRRCMVFDCRLHGSSSAVIYPTEKQFYWSEHEDDRKPCGDHCYLTLNKKNSALEVQKADEKRVSQTTTIVKFDTTSIPEAPLSTQNLEKRKFFNDLDTIPQEVENISDDSQSSRKKPKKLAVLDIEPGSTQNIPAQDDNFSVDLYRKSQQATETHEEKKLIHSKELEVSGVARKCEWRQMEKELYMKGLEIFGRNSCLIARNLLSGLKTCSEVSRYMYDGGISVPHKSLAGSTSTMDENRKTDADHADQEIPAKFRSFRRRGKSRKHKYSTKSPGHPSMWKRIADGKHQCKQYTPCGCKSVCGKQCSCVLNGTCCEKYCGCSKSCKNRFRGCHCAKSQCRSRQCPCFAAGRECDPDVCRNCWVSCGDGTLDEPPRPRDGQCGNMRLLLRQQQRILLAESDVAGWGAFIKNSVNKNDYLGEYTGEIISHREADKRGKIYDRANSSFLFDLNEQYVLDAYRKGDKLKFANHSSNPNCYAKVMLVAGDHRVGIFAKEHIEASEELFYDYRYGPDQAPVWARKPEGSKRDDMPASQGRAKKHQSH